MKSFDNMCVYVVTENILYMNMAYTSIFLLRKYNKTIPVTVFFIQDGDKLKTTNNQLDYDEIEKIKFSGYKIANNFFVQKLQELNVNILFRPPHPQDENFIHANRMYIYELKEKNVFFIDADTFIFGDIMEIFNKYEKYDFVALQAPWIQLSNNFGYISKKYFNGATPFAGCLLFFGNNKAKIWSSQLASKVKEIFKNEEIKHWIKKQDLFPIRDELATLKIVSDNNFNSTYFDLKDCCQINNFESLDQKIVHTFSHLWQKKYKKIFKKNNLPFRP